MSGTQNSNLHEGHRQRMKERILKHGVDAFDDYQLLEVLLFYAIPKKDTNELAHTLINTFGSMDKVFKADYEDLVKIKGIGENAASLLKLFPLLARRYINSTFSEDGKILLNTPDKLVDYCLTLFLGETDESVYALALNSDLTLSSCIRLNKGFVNKVELSYRMLTEFAIKSHCSRIVLTHNHSNGSVIASKADLRTTIDIADFLASVDMELVDHIIIGKGTGISMRECHMAEQAWAYGDGMF